MIFRTGLQPDGVRAAFQQLPRLGIGHDRSAGRHHHRFVLHENLHKKIIGAALVVSFPMKREQFAQDEVGVAFNQGIQFNKPDPKMLRKSLPNGGFPGSAQAHQRHDTFFLLVCRHERYDRNVQSLCHIRETRH